MLVRDYRESLQVARFSPNTSDIYKRLLQSLTRLHSKSCADRRLPITGIYNPESQNWR